MNLSGLPPEIWCLIFKALPQQDVRNVCGVSRLFDTLATPLLYRSVIFRKSDAGSGFTDWSQFPDDDNTESQNKAGDLKFILFYRLLDDRNDALRSFVRQITVEVSSTNFDKYEAWQKLQPPRDLLAALIPKLPNLNAIFFEGELPITDNLVHAFMTHQKSPKLYLMRENGHNTHISAAKGIPCVAKLSISVDATATVPRRVPSIQAEQGPQPEFEPQELAIHEILTGFPNLEDLSVSVNTLRGGCVWDSSPVSTRISPLSLPRDATFPNLKHFSLSGYHIKDTEQSCWKNVFPWANLESIRLGVQNNHGVLEAATGNVHDLKKFEITSYTRYTLLSSTPELESFLCSFNSLESLIAKGLVPSLTSVFHHPNLKHLCLHAIEETDQERRTLKVEELKEVDRHCPNLTSLEIDINPNDTWPEDIIYTIATGFQNLRELSIHVGFGIARAIDKAKDGFSLNKAFASVFTQETAKDFAKQVLDKRGSSALEKITMKTGESLRWFPQWSPGYADAEQECARIFEISIPANLDYEPRLKEIETAHANLWRKIENRRRLRRAAMWDRPEHPSKPLSRAPRILRTPTFTSGIS